MKLATYSEEVSRCAGCRQESLLCYGDWLKRGHTMRWFCEECVIEAIEVEVVRRRRTN